MIKEHTELSKAQEERDTARQILASAADLLNSWARERGVQVTTRPEGLQSVIERLRSHHVVLDREKSIEIAHLRRVIDRAQERQPRVSRETGISR